MIGSSVGFYLPLSVVPRYEASSGSGVAAGLAAGVLRLAVMAVELATPSLLRRLGYQLSLAIGLALLATSSLAVVAAVSMVRDIGFAITTVAGGALTASLIKIAARRGTWA